MSNAWAKIAGLVAAIGVVLAHISGGLREIEWHISPTVAAFSFDWFKEGNPILENSSVYAAAKGALSGALEDSGDDKIAASAACEFLNSAIEETQDHQQLVAGINQYVAPGDRNNFLVEEEVGSLADKFQGLTAPGSFGYLYRRVCPPIMPGAFSPQGLPPFGDFPGHLVVAALSPDHQLSVRAAHTAT